MVDDDSREKKLERYSKARKFTGGIVFFSGNGELDEDVMHEVQRRADDKALNENRVAQSKKKRLLTLQIAVNSIKIKRKKRGFKPSQLKVPELKERLKDAGLPLAGKKAGCPHSVVLLSFSLPFL